MLDGEVSVEEDRLDPREQRTSAIQVAPTRLHHPYFRIVEVRNSPTQKVRRRNEIGVKHTNELATRDAQSSFQRARLEAATIRPTQVHHGQSVADQVGHAVRHGIGRAVARVVQHLDLQPITRIVERRYGIEQSLNDIEFVE